MMPLRTGNYPIFIAGVPDSYSMLRGVDLPPLPGATENWSQNGDGVWIRIVGRKHYTYQDYNSNPSPMMVGSILFKMDPNNWPETVTGFYVVPSFFKNSNLDKAFFTGAQVDWGKANAMISGLQDITATLTLSWTDNPDDDGVLFMKALIPGKNKYYRYQYTEQIETTGSINFSLAIARKQDGGVKISPLFINSVAVATYATNAKIDATGYVQAYLANRLCLAFCEYAMPNGYTFPTEQGESSRAAVERLMDATIQDGLVAETWGGIEYPIGVMTLRRIEYTSLAIDPPFVAPNTGALTLSATQRMSARVPAQN
jgi:hypothetical protein